MLLGLNVFGISQKNFRFLWAGFWIGAAPSQPRRNEADQASHRIAGHRNADPLRSREFPGIWRCHRREPGGARLLPKICNGRMRSIGNLAVKEPAPHRHQLETIAAKSRDARLLEKLEHKKLGSWIRTKVGPASRRGLHFKISGVKESWERSLKLVRWNSGMSRIPCLLR